MPNIKTEDLILITFWTSLFSMIFTFVIVLCLFSWLLSGGV